MGKNAFQKQDALIKSCQLLWIYSSHVNLLGLFDEFIHYIDTASLQFLPAYDTARKKYFQNSVFGFCKKSLEFDCFGKGVCFGQCRCFYSIPYKEDIFVLLFLIAWLSIGRAIIRSTSPCSAAGGKPSSEESLLRLIGRHNAIQTFSCKHVHRGLENLNKVCRQSYLL